MSRVSAFVFLHALPFARAQNPTRGVWRVAYSAILAADEEAISSSWYRLCLRCCSRGVLSQHLNGLEASSLLPGAGRSREKAGKAILLSRVRARKSKETRCRACRVR